MDLNKELSLNRIPLIMHLNKLKRPIISLLNEYENDEDINYDVFERSGNGICAMVDIPEDLTELHGSLEDMIRVAQIASLKYEIGRDALRLAVHLFYRIILKKKMYNYHDFILYYEQYNKSWMVFSEEYHNTYKERQHSMNLEETDEMDLQQVNPSRFERNKHTEDLASFKDLLTYNKTVEKEERVTIGKNQPIEGTKETKCCDEVSSLPLSSLQLQNGKQRTNVDFPVEKEKSDDEVLFKPSDCGVKQSCFYIDEDGFAKECSHSQFVLYQLYRTGDFLMAPGDSGDHHRECPCYKTKCTVIREIHPCYRDIAWGNKYHCMFRYWCFINCSIRIESLKMLKAIQPWIVQVREGLLVPCSLTNLKRLSLRTTALKSLIYNYLNVYRYVEKTRCLNKSL